MAKVKKTETNLKPGKPAKKTETNGNEVTVTRNGIERTFTRAMWDNLPPGKDGWEEVQDTPKLPAKPKEPATNYDDAVKAYTDAFGQTPGQDLSLEEINAAIAEKGKDNA